MRFIYLFLFVTMNNLFFTQTKVTNKLQTYSFDKLKGQFYNYYENSKIDQSKTIAQYYLQKAKREKNTLQIAEGYILMHLNEDLPTALKYLDSLEIITKNIKGNLYPARTYITKGNLYFKHDNLKASLDNYILGLQFAKEQKDQKQTAYANLNIAYLNSYIGKNAEAAKTFKYYLNNSNNIADESQKHQIRAGLIYCYIELNKLDSANILINEGQKSALLSKSEYSINQYHYLSGFSNLKQKKYTAAIAKLSKAYNYFSTIDDNNRTNILFNLGEAYEGLNNKELAVQSFIKLDSSVSKSNITFPELREVYTYLIDYYKEKNNKEKQLYYIDRFLKVDKKLDEQFKYLATELPKKYDTPNLLQEKESIINDLKNRKKTLYASIGILLIMFLSILYLYYKAKKTAKKHRKIAQELIQGFETRSSDSSAEIEKVIPESQNHGQIQEIENKIINTISDDVTQFILKELEAFENKKLFLKSGITLASLAKSIKTNTAYLSEVINSHKGKNFNSYLNDLRIDYVLERLVKDKKFRSYKLPAIAEEIGYNNVQAFSVVFKKKTGTTPSIYIKEIENSIIA